MPLSLSAPSRRDAVVSATPVVLAPMAGITNAAYRQLCREQGEGLYVCEMITSRALVERHEKTLRMMARDPGAEVFSVQLYGVDPAVMARATHIACDELGANHIDLNFGCPVPKVTRKGGGGVLPWKRDLLREILEATVKAADTYGVPVTIKTRVGIDADHTTYLDAGQIAEETGCAAITLHGRTVQQSYGGRADWSTIARLVEHVSIPVLGNGDVWEAADALRLVEQTGAVGVVVGRGCLGRPWLFRDLEDAFAGRGTRTLPTLGEVCAVVRRHAELLAGTHGEGPGCRDLRKHMAWYFKGFGLGGELRQRLGMVDSIAELDALLAQMDPATPWPQHELGKPRGRQGSSRAKVAMPSGWLDDMCGLDVDLADAETDESGG